MQHFWLFETNTALHNLPGYEIGNPVFFIGDWGGAAPSVTDKAIGSNEKSTAKV